MGSGSKAPSSGMTATRSRCEMAVCVRLSTKPASSICTRPGKANGSTCGSEQTIPYGDAQRLIFRQWAHDDCCSGSIQLSQPGKEAAGQGFLIFEIPPAINQ